MPKYVIEREIPAAGKLSQSDLQSIAKKSCSVIDNIGTEIQWIESYVTDNKIYCIYLAPNEDVIKRHATEGGFPAHPINQVRNVFSPLTAEG